MGYLDRVFRLGEFRRLPGLAYRHPSTESQVEVAPPSDRRRSDRGPVPLVRFNPNLRAGEFQSQLVRLLHSRRVVVEGAYITRQRKANRNRLLVAKTSDSPMNRNC